MKSLIVLSAVAGCGKSTWSKMYTMRHRHVKVVSSDEIRKEVTGAYQNLTMEDKVWATIFERVNQYALEGHDDEIVILDATNLKNAYRQNALDKCGHNFGRKVLIILKKPLDLILEQNKMRTPDKIVPEEVVKSMYASMEEPTEELLKGFDEYCVYYKTFEYDKFKDFIDN